MWQGPLTFLILTLLLGCQPPPPKAAGPPQRIRIACTLQPQSTLVHVALAKGYFPEEGLEVETVVHTYGRAALQSVLDQQADVATVAETPFMFSVLKGDKLFIIANIEASNANNGVVARRDAGIATQSHLKGKRIGFTPGTTSEFFLDSFLTSLGLTRKDIQPVELNPEEMEAAILGKRVAAVSTWNYPLTSIRRQLGDNGVLFYDHEIYTETFNLAAQQTFVHLHPETVKRLLRAILRAEQFVARHPDESQAILSRVMHTDVGLIREVWTAFHYRAELDDTILITLEDETRWAMKQRLTEAKAMPDYRAFIHADSLRAIKPEAVTLSR